MNVELGPKRLGLLHELLPGSRALCRARQSQQSQLLSPIIADARAAAAAIGRQIEVFTASTNREIDAAFASLVAKAGRRTLVGPHPLFANRRVQIATLAAHYAVPTIYADRENASKPAG